MKKATKAQLAEALSDLAGMLLCVVEPGMSSWAEKVAAAIEARRLISAAKGEAAFNLARCFGLVPIVMHTHLPRCWERAFSEAVVEANPTCSHCIERQKRQQPPIGDAP